MLPWPILAVAFAAAELKVVQVHFRRETHSFSLSEFPAVIGFFFLSPFDYVVALLVGSTIAFVISGRQRIEKIVFNLANFALVAVVELAVLYAISDMGGQPHFIDWLAAFAATLAATFVSALTIATVITISGGAPQFEKLPEMIQFGSMVAVANTSLALLAVSVMWIDPVLLWLLVLPLATVFLAYQAYVSEREKHERLEFLYQSSRILQHSPELDSTLVALLGHARAMFRAEVAELILYPRVPRCEALRTRRGTKARPRSWCRSIDPQADPLHARVRDATARLLPADQPRGVGRTGQRHGQSAARRIRPHRLDADRQPAHGRDDRSREDDLRLLETLANQAAVALENGHLEQSLAQLSRLKEQLRYQAYHDSLTGLANRSAVPRPGRRARSRTRTAGGLPVVLFLDLDDFKTVNDTPRPRRRRRAARRRRASGSATASAPATSSAASAATSSPSCSRTGRTLGAP